MSWAGQTYDTLADALNRTARLYPGQFSMFLYNLSGKVSQLRLSGVANMQTK